MPFIWSSPATSISLRIYLWLKKKNPSIIHRFSRAFFIHSFTIKRLGWLQKFAIMTRVAIRGVLVSLCSVCLRCSRLCLLCARYVWWHTCVTPVMEGHIERGLWSLVAAGLAKSVSSRFMVRTCLRKWQGNDWRRHVISTSGISNGVHTDTCTCKEKDGCNKRYR